MAGKIEKQLAEKFEEDVNHEMAVSHYKKAADYFSMESTNSKSYEQGCLLKAADLMCIHDYKTCFKEASDIYEKVGMQYLQVPLLKAGAKDLFFKNVCLHLAYGDTNSALAALNKYVFEDPTFDDTREKEFLLEAINALNSKKADELQNSITKLHKYNSMDKWRINVFTKIRGRLTIEISPGQEINWK